MNIQIFGKPKCFDTKKAERFFKERRIPYQLIDVTRKGSLEALLDEKSPAYAAHYVAYLALESQREEKLLEHQEMLKTPVVRCGRKAAVGYRPEVWQSWIDAASED